MSVVESGFVVGAKPNLLLATSYFITFDPDQKLAAITKLFAPKFCAECTGRELHSSNGDAFREKNKI